MSVSDTWSLVIVKPFKYRYTNIVLATMSGTDRLEQMRNDQFRFRFSGRTTDLEKSIVLQSIVVCHRRSSNTPSTGSQEDFTHSILARGEWGTDLGTVVQPAVTIVVVSTRGFSCDLQLHAVVAALCKPCQTLDDSRGNVHEQRKQLELLVLNLGSTGHSITAIGAMWLNANVFQLES